jgi:hypothetical protein
MNNDHKHKSNNGSRFIVIGVKVNLNLSIPYDFSSNRISYLSCCHSLPPLLS